MDAISCTQARNSLSTVMVRVTENHEPLIITPRKGKTAVLISLEDYNAWQETHYLTRSSANVAASSFAEECHRQSLLLKNDALEKNTAEWLESVADCDGWE